MSSVSDARVGKSAAWALLGGALQQGSQIFVTLVLAAILGPEKWGVIALATTYVLLIEFLVRQGMIQAIIQRDTLEDEHLDSAFALLIGSGLILGVLTINVAGWWSARNDAPDLEPILVALSGLAVLQGAWQVPIALIQRNLDFKLSTTVLNGSTIIGGIAGVISALAGLGEWSVVVQLYVYSGLAVFASYRAVEWRPRLRFSRPHAKALMGVSLGAFVASLGAFVSQQSDSIFMGMFFGPVAFAFYRFATRFAQSIIDVTAGSLGRVGLVTLSRQQNDPEKFRGEVVRMLGSLTLVAIPLLGVLGGSGASMIRLLKAEWYPAASALRILCLAGIARGLVLYVNPILQARGKAFVAAGGQWFAGAAQIASLIVAWLVTGDDASVTDQVVAVATARFVVQLVVITPVLLWLTGKYTGARPFEVFSTQLPAVVAAMAAFGVGNLVDQALLKTDLPTLVVAGIVATVATVVAGSVLYTISSPARRLVREGRVKLEAVRAR